MKWSKAQTEQRLNEYYAEQSWEYAEDVLGYLTAPNRKPRTQMPRLRKMYERRTLGTAMRRLDPIAFGVVHEEWKREAVK